MSDQLVRVMAGESRLIAVDGVAGIGKTALVRHFADTAAIPHVLWTSGEVHETLLPYGLVAQLIPRSGALGGWGKPGGANVDPHEVGSALLEGLGSAEPVLVVVDDAQWADHLSLRALTFALRRLRDERILAVLVARDIAHPRLPDGFRRLLAADDTVHLPLGGLSVEDLIELHPMPRQVADRLRAHTDGNPAHATALLEQVPPEVLTDPHTLLPAPRSFEWLVRARLAECDTSTGALLAAASVLGLSCTLHDAAEVGQVGRPLAALEEATVAGLLTARASGDGMVIAFVNPLTHSAVYHGLGPKQRADLHLRVATKGGDASAGLARLAVELGPLAETRFREHLLDGLAGATVRGRPGAAPAYQPRPDRLWTYYLLCLVACGSIDRALQHTAVLPDPVEACSRELDALVGRGVLLMCVDELTESARVLTGVIAAAGSKPYRQAALAALSLTEYRRGNWDDSVRYAVTAVALAPDPWTAAMAHGLAALVPAARGDWDQAAAHIRAARPVEIGTLLAKAHVAGAQGDTRWLVTELASKVDIVKDPALMPCHEWVIDALVATGEHRRAEALLTQYEKLAAVHYRRSALATTARIRASLHTARQCFAAAEDSYQQSLSYGRQIATPFDLARLELDFGTFLRARGRSDDATDRLESARRTLDRLGAKPYLARCERELTACRRSPTRAGSSTAQLSPQEQAISRLVAKGLTNRQIAKELVLSVKTIEYHLGRIYARLGVPSRAGLVGRLAMDRVP